MGPTRAESNNQKDGGGARKEFRIKTFMHSNLLSPPHIPTTPAATSGTKELLESTFISSFGQEQTNDTKMKEY